MTRIVRAESLPRENAVCRWGVNMYLWGAAPLVAAAFMLSGPGLAAAPAQPSSGTTLAVTSAVLTQVGVQTWETTVQLTDSSSGCPPSKGHFALETSPPDQVIPASNVVPLKSTSQPSVSECTTAKVFFSPITQVPDNVTLVFTNSDGTPSSVPLTVSRTVNLIDYLLVPAAAGLGLLVLLLALVFCCVTTRDWDGSPMRPVLFRRERRRRNGFWQQSVLASGAWTANDSWATNISASVAILGSVLTITSAADSLFPGVALDRFALLTLVAGGIVTAVPIVFGICYARWTTRYPGLTPDSLIYPTLKLGTKYTAELCEDARVEAQRAIWRLGEPTTIPSGKLVELPKGTQVVVTDGSPVHMTKELNVMLRPGAVFVPPSAGQARTSQPRTPEPPVEVTLHTKTQLITGPSCWAWIRREQKVTVSADPDGKAQRDGLKREAEISLPYGALAKWDDHHDTSTEPEVWPVAGLKVSGRSARINGGTEATWSAKPVRFPAGVEVRLGEPVEQQTTEDSQCALNPAVTAPSSKPKASKGLVTAIRLPDGAELALAGGAAIGPADQRDQWPAQVKDGGKIQVPPGSTIEIYAATAIALPGGSDVVVAGESALKIICDSGLLSIAADNLAPLPKAAAKDGGQDQGKDKADPVDVALAFPVCAFAPGGAKITVAGSADLRLPAGLAVTAPRRKDFILDQCRHVIVPQASGTTLVANMGLVVIAALVTIFGIGAQLGIAAILMALSDATLTGQMFAWGAMAVVTIALLAYSVTAIRALADPQPGSSISATSGTSFTL